MSFLVSRIFVSHFLVVINSSAGQQMPRRLFGARCVRLQVGPVRVLRGILRRKLRVDVGARGPGKPNHRRQGFALEDFFV